MIDFILHFLCQTVREKQRRLGAEPPAPLDSRTATIYSAPFSARQILALVIKSDTFTRFLHYFKQLCFIFSK